MRGYLQGFFLAGHLRVVARLYNKLGTLSQISVITVTGAEDYLSSWLPVTAASILSVILGLFVCHSQTRVVHEDSLYFDIIFNISE